MKIIYKGLFKDNSQFPIGVLPENAVKINAPESIHKQMLISLITIIPAGLLVLPFIYGSYLLHGDLSSVGFRFMGMAWYFVVCIPHELLHAICFGKNAEILLFASPPAWMIHCVKPLSKSRYILMCMLPNIVFGWIPLFIWMLLPYYEGISHILFTASVFAIVLGGGDYMNIFYTLKQQPNGSLQQLSGSMSYWFMPEKQNVL